ncbi:Histidine biosynthesis bifunctional protein hisB [Pichia californica]|uniref:Imidazole glycerol phosphate synthase hisHF n=1 Tax=Pichia californica TaxID=460514 RepID=A0A9P7BGW5_9ASCO|nr:Histidine biosynthesis bifunctional protein hisB [[Candida] californica]KAG0689735.1 Histidine biosynthesis bifunctional protein hisB [[Candida] californica]
MSNTVHVIDVDSGNLQSLLNAITSLGFNVKFITHGDDPALKTCEKLILPGVGNFGHFVKEIHNRNFLNPLKEYINSGKPIMGICVGLQTLFNGSDESNNINGLSILPGKLSKFNSSTKSVPQIGWNSISLNFSNNNNNNSNSLFGISEDKFYYFVHSYAAIRSKSEIDSLINQGWDLATCTYLDETFIASVSKDNIFATQFHPEKSGIAGLKVIKSFLINNKYSKINLNNKNLLNLNSNNIEKTSTGLTRRIVACLDVRSNDQGDLVVTKGDQYDVREKSTENNVRNLGKPVEMAEKYYKQGADEVTFLNITSFRNSPIKDLPMLEVLRLAAKTCFVPLTVGGGIKDFIDPDGTKYSALNVASMYFKAGADKISIGSDAVRTAEEYYLNNCKGLGNSPIETISAAYGVQAVVISIDPKRFYINDPSNCNYKTIKTSNLGPNNEEYCYYKVTSQGGRKIHDLGAVELAIACENLGAGEILLNCIDKDGSNSGYDFELINMVKSNVSIPVIASSGAGNPQHFVDVFKNTKTDAALGAGMFHRGDYKVSDVKEFMAKNGLLVRIDDTTL